MAGLTPEHGKVRVVEIEMVVGGRVAADGAGVAACAAGADVGAGVAEPTT